MNFPSVIPAPAFALANTYKIAPETFVDIEDVITKNLKQKTKTELLEIIKEMILQAPGSLVALIRGVLEEFEV